MSSPPFHSPFPAGGSGQPGADQPGADQPGADQPPTSFDPRMPYPIPSVGGQLRPPASVGSYHATRPGPRLPSLLYRHHSYAPRAPSAPRVQLSHRPSYQPGFNAGRGGVGGGYPARPRLYTQPPPMVRPTGSSTDGSGPGVTHSGGAATGVGVGAGSSSYRSFFRPDGMPPWLLPPPELFDQHSTGRSGGVSQGYGASILENHNHTAMPRAPTVVRPAASVTTGLPPAIRGVSGVGAGSGVGSYRPPPGHSPSASSIFPYPSHSSSGMQAAGQAAGQPMIGGGVRDQGNGPIALPVVPWRFVPWSVMTPSGVQLTRTDVSLMVANILDRTTGIPPWINVRWDEQNIRFVATVEGAQCSAVSAPHSYDADGLREALHRCWNDLRVRHQHEAAAAAEDAAPNASVAAAAAPARHRDMDDALDMDVDFDDSSSGVQPTTGGDIREQGYGRAPTSGPSGVDNSLLLGGVARPLGGSPATGGMMSRDQDNPPAERHHTNSPSSRPPPPHPPPPAFGLLGRYRPPSPPPRPAVPLSVNPQHRRSDRRRGSDTDDYEFEDVDEGYFDDLDDDFSDIPVEVLVEMERALQRVAAGGPAAAAAAAAEAAAAVAAAASASASASASAGGGNTTPNFPSVDREIKELIESLPEDEIPSYLPRCPITLDVPIIPVVTIHEGQTATTYDWTALKEVFNGNDPPLSPTSRKPLRVAHDVLADRQTRRLIEQFGHQKMAEQAIGRKVAAGKSVKGVKGAKAAKAKRGRVKRPPSRKRGKGRLQMDDEGDSEGDGGWDPSVELPSDEDEPHKRQRSRRKKQAKKDMADADGGGPMDVAKLFGEDEASPSPKPEPQTQAAAAAAAAAAGHPIGVPLLYSPSPGRPYASLIASLTGQTSHGPTEMSSGDAMVGAGGSEVAVTGGRKSARAGRKRRRRSVSPCLEEGDEEAEEVAEGEEDVAHRCSKMAVTKMTTGASPPGRARGMKATRRGRPEGGRDGGLDSVENDLGVGLPPHALQGEHPDTGYGTLAMQPGVSPDPTLLTMLASPESADIVAKLTEIANPHKRTPFTATRIRRLSDFLASLPGALRAGIVNWVHQWNGIPSDSLLLTVGLTGSEMRKPLVQLLQAVEDWGKEAASADTKAADDGPT